MGARLPLDFGCHATSNAGLGLCNTEPAGMRRDNAGVPSISRFVNVSIANDVRRMRTEQWKGLSSQRHHPKSLLLDAPANGLTDQRAEPLSLTRCR